MSERRVERWLVRFRETGDPGALGKVFDATAGELLGVARHLVGDGGEAEDLVQATFLALMEHPERYDGRRSARAWMVGILTHEARHARRRAARRVDGRRALEEAEEREAALDPAGRVARGEAAGMVRAALGRVPELYRGVLERHLAGESPATIAGELGRAPGTVRVQLHRGLDLLRRALPVGVAGGIGLAAPPEAAGEWVGAGAGGASRVNEWDAAQAGWGGIAQTAGARGLAAVRAEVMAVAHTSGAAAGAAAGAAGAAVSLGTILMAKKGVLVGVALAAAVSLWVWVDGPGPAPQPEGGDGVVRVVGAADVERVGGEASARGAGHPEAALEGGRDALGAPGAEPLRLDRLRVATVFHDGRPAPGVGFQFVSFASGAALRGATSDERGEVLLSDLEPGQYALYVDRGGYGMAQVPNMTLNAVPADPVAREALLEEFTPRHTLTLPAGQDVAGRVVDAAGRPVAGAEIWVSTGLTRRTGTVISRSEGDGSFLLPQLGEECFFGARSPQHAPTRPLSVEHLMLTARREGGEVPARLEVVLQFPGSGARVEGLVRDPAGRPVAGARVRLGAQDFFDTLGPTGAEGPPPPIEVRSDEHGRFVGEGLAPGRIEVACSAEGFPVATGAVELGAGEVGRLELDLELGVWIRGRASDAAGEPLARITVRAHRTRTHFGEPRSSFYEPSAVTDSEGRFRLGPLNSGRLALEARNEDNTRHARHSLEATAGLTYEWAFELGESPTLAGRALDETGEPLAGWTVSARPMERLGPPPRATFTDSDGRFVLRFPAGGSVRLELLAPDGPSRSSTRIAPRAPQAWIEGVAVGAQDVRLVLDPARRPRARLRGALRIAAHPAPERAVFRVRHPEFGLVAEEELPLAPGAFELAELPAGRFDFWIEAPGCAPLERRGLELAQGQVLELGALELVGAAEFVLHFSDAERTNLQPHVELRDAAGRSRWGTLEGRTWRSVALAPGAYRLRVQHEGRADLALELELRAGEVVERELALRPGASLGLVFLDAQGTPITGEIRIRVRDGSGQVVLEEELLGTAEQPASRSFNAPFGALTVEATDREGRTANETFEHSPTEGGGRSRPVVLR